MPSQVDVNIKNTNDNNDNTNDKIDTLIND